jgi:hypothetical protein
MSPRHTRRPRPRQQTEENPVDKLRLAEFKAEFPQEVTQIRNLAPLQARPDLLDDFLLTVENIVGLGRRRLAATHVERIVQSIRSSKDAADKITAIAEALGKMDAGQLGSVLSFATEVFPRPFFKTRDPLGIFRVLRDVRQLLLTLHVAIQIGTGEDDQPRRRGRPSSSYVQQVFELMEAWEVVTAEQLWGEDSPVWVLKRVPTPKKLHVNDKKIVIKQPSTEFIRIALRMINPAITDAQVFTAIKKALSLRDEVHEFIKAGLPKTIAGKLRAFDRFRTRRASVRKRPA